MFATLHPTRRLAGCLAAIVFALGLMPFIAFAEQGPAHGSDSRETFAGGSFALEAQADHGAVAFGPYNVGKPTATDVTATIYEDGTMVVSGSGDVLSAGNDREWKSYFGWVDDVVDGKKAIEAVKAVRFDEGVAPTALGRWFEGMVNLVDPGTLPTSVEEVTRTYYGCTSLVNAPVLPDGVLYMQEAYYGCTALKNVPDLPDTVISCSLTFQGCTSLETAPRLSASTSGMRYMFADCTSLKTVPDIVSAADIRNAFTNCTSLEHAPALPDGLTDMQSAFKGCTSLLASPDIPSSVINLAGAFEGCTSLAEIGSFPMTSYDATSVFRGCTALVNLPAGFKMLPGAGPADIFFADGPYSADNLLVTYCDAGDYNRLLAEGDWSEANRKLAVRGTGSTFPNVIVPETALPEAQVGWEYAVPIDFVAENVPEGCEVVSGFVGELPSGLSYNASTHVLEGTPTLSGSYTLDFTASIVESGTSGAGDVVATSAHSYALTIGARSEHGPVIYGPWMVGNPVHENATFAIHQDGTMLFSGQGDIEQIANWQTGIGGWSAKAWTPAKISSTNDVLGAVRRVEFAEGVEPTNLDYWFAYMPNLTTVVIPETVTSIKYAFYHCTSLRQSPEIPSSVTAVDYAFAGCESLCVGAVPPMTVKNPAGMYKGCSSLRTAPTMPEGITAMSNTFQDCTALVDVPDIPSSVGGLVSTFAGCTSLVEAPAIPDSVKNLTSTFMGCTSLVRAPELPSKATNQMKTFEGCTSLRYPASLKSGVATLCYSGCSGITRLPSGFSFPPNAKPAALKNVFLVGEPYSSDVPLETYCDAADYETLSAAYDWAQSNRTLVARTDAIYDDVEEALALVPEDLSGYTAQSVGDLAAAQAAVVREKPYSAQQEVDDMAKAIMDALDSLTVKTDEAEGAVADALTTLSSAIASRDGSDVYTDQLWVPQETANALGQAIETVQSAVGTASDAVGLVAKNAAITDLSASMLDLAQAQTAFEQAKNKGTKLRSTSSKPGTTSSQPKITSISSASIALGATKYTYNGKVRKPAVKSVTLNGKKLKANTDYKVSYSKGLKNVGTYKVTVAGKGAYAGSKTATFKIVKASQTIKGKAKVTKKVSFKKGKLAKKATVNLKSLAKLQAKGQLVFKKIGKTGGKKIMVAAKSGKITLAKGLKAATYKVKVRVSAKATANYKAPKARTITLIVK